MGFWANLKTIKPKEKEMLHKYEYLFIRNPKLREMDEVLQRMTSKLVVWGIAYCPPTKNDAHLRANNPRGFSFLQDYLALESEYQILVIEEKRKYEEEKSK